MPSQPHRSYQCEDLKRFELKYLSDLRVMKLIIVIAVAAIIIIIIIIIIAY